MATRKCIMIHAAQSVAFLQTVLKNASDVRLRSAEGIKLKP